jgi:hypothetical protein
LNVDIKAGAGSGGTAMTDAATYSIGVTSFTPIGGTFNPSATPLTSGQAGAVELTAARQLITVDAGTPGLFDLLSTLILETRAMRTAIVSMVTENGDSQDSDFNPDNLDFQPIN